MSRALMVIAVVLVGCGPATPKEPRPGDPCDGGEPFTCFSSGTKGVCEKGAWLEYPCDGTFVKRDGGTYTGRCDASSPQECLHPTPVGGDYCPVAFDGRVGRCISSGAIAQCQGETWRACTVEHCDEFPLNGDERNGILSSFSRAADSGCSF